MDLKEGICSHKFFFEEGGVKDVCPHFQTPRREYRRGYGYESRSGLNIFQALISQLLVYITAMINYVFISFSTVQIFDISYIYLHREEK